ncbi:recombinase family protein [Cryobacterium sp. Y62]|uniref:recombinase family protein n=1 Tax=Cryobacterium sp. Y62 TaxID=2048284 RepID=UPI000CE4BA48|nr:recombinase family protein [Cryobacterium sp. Y62]
MVIIGYARVSTREQNPGQQEAALTAAGAERIYVDRGQSSSKTSRPEFDKCLDHLRKGDVLLVYRLDRLGSDTHLISLINEFGDRGIDLRSLTEPAIDTTSPMGKALYGIVAVFAQLRVDTIRQNTRDGLAHARSEGRVGGRPTVMTPDRIAVAVDMREKGAKIEAIAETLRVGTATVRRALKKAAADAMEPTDAPIAQSVTNATA